MNNILDKLLEFAQVEAYVDVQCLLRGRWFLNKEQAQGRAYIHIILSGMGQLQIPHEIPQRLYAGDLILLPHGAEHSITDFNGQGSISPVNVRQYGAWTIETNGEGREDLTMLCGHVDYQIMSGLFQDWPNMLVIPWQQLPQLRDWVHLLQTEAVSAQLMQDGGASVIKGLSTVLLVWLIRYYCQQHGQAISPGILRGQQDGRLRPLLVAIMNEPSKDWTLESMSELVYLSRAQFIRVFQSSLGISPHRFLMQSRLSQATVYLRTRSDRVLQIALMTGFKTEQHFVRAFKHYFGQTPRQYRLKQFP